MSTTTAKSRTADHEPKLVHEAPVVDIDDEEDFLRSSRRWYRSKTLWAVGLVGALVAALVLWSGDFFGGSTEHLVFYTVQRGDLSITVSDRGTIESQENVQVLCDVDDIENDGVRGTVIQWLVPNGASVKKDEFAFSIPSATPADLKELDNGKLTPQLIAQFKAKKFALTDQAVVNVLEPGGPWQIIDTAEMVPAFTARFEEGTLNIYTDDLIIKFESTGHQERLDRQIIAYETALSLQIQAEAKHDNQKTQNETTEAEAALQVKLSELELKMYQDPASGTHRLEVEEINRLIDNVNNEILAAEADLELKKQEQQASALLFKLGYEGKSEMDRSQLALLQSEGMYASKMNMLRTQLATLQKKQTYEREMQVLTLEGKVATTKRTQSQVKRDNEALLAQAKAALDNANETLKKEKERLDRYRQMLYNCKVYAPATGMVAYAATDSKRWYLEEIRPGAPVRTRQHILSIPNLTRMQVKTSVHESVIDQVREGLPATVRMEAFPDLHFDAEVKSVAVLADQLSPESKVYQTIVTIDGEVDQLKPGMTAIVDIHVDHLEDVLSVPVQAIVQVGKESWCYVNRNGKVERQDVELGPTNHKFVEIKKGLEEGDQVVLNPMAIVDESKDQEEQPKVDGKAPPPKKKAAPPESSPEDSPRTSPVSLPGGPPGDSPEGPRGGPRGGGGARKGRAG
jgi:RND family efflux transporter MFP subunit